jgi:hypothetical protein
VKRFVLLALLLMMVSGARADEDTIDMTHAVFVAMDGSAMVPFIDPTPTASLARSTSAWFQARSSWHPRSANFWPSMAKLLG